MLFTLQEALSFCEVKTQEFEISGNNNVLIMKYDAGSATTITLTNASYSADALATHLQTLIDAAFTISSTVSYSTTTDYFTIAVAAGHTIQYINSGSSAGATIGFTEDSDASVSISSDTICGDPSNIIGTLRTDVDKFVKEYCRRDFDSTSYTEYYNGNGTSVLFLNQFPVTAITRVSTGRRGIFTIYNTGTTTYATASCDGTNLTLNKDGSTTTLALGTYTTLTLLKNAVDALGSGWTTETLNSNYIGALSSEIINFYGVGCLDSERATVEIPFGSVDIMEVSPDNGVVYFGQNLPVGKKNVRISYTAGFTTIPADLKMAALIILKSIYAKWTDNSFGMEGYKIADISKYNLNELDPYAYKALQRYKRVMA